MHEVDGASWKAFARHVGRTNGGKIANRNNRRKAELEAAGERDTGMWGGFEMLGGLAY